MSMSAPRSAVPARRSARTVSRLVLRRDRTQQLSVFARQMTMLLHAGAPVVSAIRAIAEQTRRGDYRSVVESLAESVEGGATLHEAMARHPNWFSPGIRSIAAAGEATGTLALSFQRLSGMLEGQARTRRKIVGALVYPAMLLFMSASLLLVLCFFVLPRFADLFELLDVELPLLTGMMLDGAAWLKDWWMVVVLAPVALLAPPVLWMRSAPGRRVLGQLVLRVPLIGRAVSGVILAKLLRTWSALLRSNVPLLEAVRHTRDVTGNPAFRELIARIQEAVTAGQGMASAMQHARVVPSTIAAAVATGEASGRLGESMELVATWLEEQNENLIGTMTRLFEPVILLLLGVVVGGVSISLFLPLFEVATAA